MFKCNCKCCGVVKFKVRGWIGAFDYQILVKHPGDWFFHHLGLEDGFDYTLNRCKRLAKVWGYKSYTINTKTKGKVVHKA